ncbi:MAG: DUF5908 family protein [Flavobacteriales bacterium]
MPIEIRELVVKMNVQKNDGSTLTPQDLAELKSSIVQDCLAKINKHLQHNSER